MSESNNNAAPRYEKPTDEFRQVVSNAMEIRFKGKSTPFLVVQSLQHKWLIQDGEPIPRSWIPLDAEAFVESGADHMYEPLYIVLKSEWRDLPIVIRDYRDTI
jgi:hypothetical protein